MLVIRLLRVGKKNQPSFKIVVTEKKRPPRGGRFVEQLGFYNPLTKEKSINKERVSYWLSKGAKPSDTLHNLLVKEGIIKGPKIPVHKVSKKKEPASAKATAGKEEKVVQQTEAPVETPKKEAPQQEQPKAPEQKEEPQKEESKEAKPQSEEKPKEEAPVQETKKEEKEAKPRA